MADYTLAIVVLFLALVIGIIPIIGGIGLVIMTILYNVVPTFLGDFPMEAFQGAFFVILLALIIINVLLSIPFLMFFGTNVIAYIILFIIHIFFVYNLITATVGIVIVSGLGLAIYYKRDVFKRCKCAGEPGCECTL